MLTITQPTKPFVASSLAELVNEIRTECVPKGYYLFFRSKNLGDTHTMTGRHFGSRGCEAAISRGCAPDRREVSSPLPLFHYDGVRMLRLLLTGFLGPMAGGTYLASCEKLTGRFNRISCAPAG
jgi:hypothetical protein